VPTTEIQGDRKVKQKRKRLLAEPLTFAFEEAIGLVKMVGDASFELATPTV
jgi:hypothetical protein